MAKREYKKPRLSFQAEVEDKESLDAVTAFVVQVLPALNPEQSQSMVLRAALRLGLLCIAREPGLAFTARPTKEHILSFLAAHPPSLKGSLTGTAPGTEPEEGQPLPTNLLETLFGELFGEGPDAPSRPGKKKGRRANPGA